MKAGLDVLESLVNLPAMHADQHAQTRDQQKHNADIPERTP